MTVSFYSFVTAILWFSLFILIGTFLQRKTDFIFCYELVPLLSLLILTIFRLVVPIETPFTEVIRSTTVYPAIRDFLQSAVTITGRATVSVTALFLFLWAAGAVFFCGKLVWDLYDTFRKVRLRSKIPHPEAEEILEKQMAQRGCRRKAALIFSVENETPMVIGFFKPILLLPTEINQLTPRQLEFLIEHELTHYFNHDLWVMLLVRLFASLMWWNPFIHLLSRDLDSALEFKCDLAVTKGMSATDECDYLQMILDFQKILDEKGRLSMAAGFCGIAENFETERRFKLVLNKPVRRHRRLAAAFMAVFLVLFVGSYSFVLQPASEPPISEITSTVTITPENSYILKTADGTYHMVYNGKIYGEIQPEDINKPPNCLLSIKTES